MKFTIKFSITAFFLLCLQSSSFAVNTTVQSLQDDIFTVMMTNLTVDEISELSRKEIEQKIGKKFKLTERAGLILGKYKINRLFKKGHSVDSVNDQVSRGDFSFSIGGFLLGFFFSLLGVLLAWLFWGSKGLKSAVFGAIFNVILIWLGYRSFR